MSEAAERASCAVRRLTEDEYPEWRAMVDRSPHGSVYHLPEYLDALCVAVGGSFRIHGAFKGGALHGGIALYETPSSSGPIFSSRLLLYYHGIVLRDHETKYPSLRTARDIETLGALKSFLESTPSARLVLHNRPPLADLRVFRAPGWTVRPSYTYVVPIDHLADQWALVEKNCRRLIERCREQSMRYTEDDDFDSFFRLHRETFERKAAPLYLPEQKFRTFFERLRSNGLARLAHARMSDGKVIASQLVLHSGHPVTHTVCAGADAKFLRLGGNAFLRWSAFESLANDGFHANDLTDAALNPVTHFKSQFGGELQTTWVVTRPDALLLRAEANVKRLRRGAASLVRRVTKAKGASAEGGAE